MKRSDHDADVSRETRDRSLASAVGTDAQYAALSDDLGCTLTPGQVAQLQGFGAWLHDEAIPAGGIGPDEGPRLFDRHLADGLAYVPYVPPGAVTTIDVGSGVGLPGIPIAIARPDLEVTVLDRSERRTWLARRATRVLALDNVSIVTSDVRSVDATFDVAVFRASLRVEAAARSLHQLVGAEGMGLFGLSRRHDRPGVPEPPGGVTFELVERSSPILDSPFWLLRMRRSNH